MFNIQPLFSTSQAPPARHVADKFPPGPRQPRTLPHHDKTPHSTECTLTSQQLTSLLTSQPTSQLVSHFSDRQRSHSPETSSDVLSDFRLQQTRVQCFQLCETRDECFHTAGDTSRPDVPEPGAGHPHPNRREHTSALPEGLRQVQRKNCHGESQTDPSENCHLNVKKLPKT